jgi:signal transduction histidine kinase
MWLNCEFVDSTVQTDMPHYDHAISPMKVLVADDIAASRQELMGVVRGLGHQAIEAASGAEALELIEQFQPDVLLLDLLMPGMNGFEVSRAIRQRNTGKWLPVIVLSALQGDEHYAHALASGASDSLLKPVNPAILQAKLRQYQRVLSLQDKLSVMAQRQYAIHENIADALITLDQNGHVSELNRAARLLIQQDGNSLQLGATILQLTGMDLANFLDLPEITLHQSSGAQLTCSISHSYWKMEKQQFCTIALHDISEARRVERMKDEFLATVSHELRTPLTSILGALGLLAAGAGGAMPERALDLANVAKRNGDRLSRLIDDVLDLTKLEGNRMPLNLRPSDLTPLIREAVNANTGYAQRGGVSLRFEERVLAGRAQVDPDRFLQIMANLLSNAIKHTPKGKTVQIDLAQTNTHLKVSVIDEGPGIDPAFRKKLFEKFSQADSSDRRAVGGTGLGLYISRILVEKMGGTIQAEPGTGGGSAFSVTLPRLVQTYQRPWILCIAQDHQFLERIADWLSGLAIVELASNLVSAEALLQRNDPVALVLANPQSQGSADIFCSTLVKFQLPAPMILISDAIDEGFALRYGMGWISADATPKQELVKRVSSALTGQIQGGSHGGL